MNIAYVTLDNCKLGVRREMVAKPHNVEGNNVVTRLQKFGNEHCAFITAGAGNQNFHNE